MPIRLLAIILASIYLASLAGAAVTIATAHAPGCGSRSCEVRVQQRVAHEKWRPIVAAYGIARLDARMRCESGGHGGYSLSTTGNGFWFSMQWEPRAWYGAGGRRRHGRPAGVWTMQPSTLEQRVRAIYWERIHGGDAWPNCP